MARLKPFTPRHRGRWTFLSVILPLLLKGVGHKTPLRGHAQIALNHLDREARAEAVQGVANALVAYARLVELGTSDAAY